MAEHKNHKPDCKCGYCTHATMVKESKEASEMSFTDKLKSQSIQPDDLMWHLEATERELGEYYTASANAMNRIRAIRTLTALLLAELQKNKGD